MPLAPVYYQITISAAGLTSVSAPNNGFIDNVQIEEYGRTSSYPSSLQLSEAKARANARYDYLISLLSENQTITNILNIDNGGADRNNEGSYFSFVVVYDREDYIYTENELYGVSGDPTEFIKILTSAPAIRRQVARLFTQNFSTQKIMPLDPASVSAGYGWLDVDLEVGTPLTGSLQSKINTAESNITVVKII